jgi:hypothetical protein
VAFQKIDGAHTAEAIGVLVAKILQPFLGTFRCDDDDDDDGHVSIIVLNIIVIISVFIFSHL